MRIDPSESSTQPITPGPVDLATVPRRRSAMASVVIESETLLMHEDNGQIFLLNPSGSVIWACIDGVSTVEAIAVDVAHVFGLPPDKVTRDVLEVIRALGQAGALHGVEPTLTICGPTGSD